MLTRLLKPATFLALTAPAFAQSIIYSEGFESGFTNWTATGLWHLENATDPCGATEAPFPEGTKCAYYGIPTACNFATGTSGNAGMLTLVNPIAIPAGVTRVSLHCWMLHDTESCSSGFGFDFSRIEVSNNSGGSWTVIANRCVAKFAAPDFWNPRAMDLSAYQGQSILLRFSFDSVDDFTNDGLGVMLDRITVQVESGTTFCTSLCPCLGPYNLQFPGNPQGQISGCRNSLGKDGELSGDGNASLTSDTLTLRAREVPPTSIGMLVQGNSFNSGANLGEGRFCITLGATRAGIAVASSGVMTWPVAGGPSLSSLTALPGAGGVRHYQVQYRDNASYCNSTNFNWTNGYSIVWTP